MARQANPQSSFTGRQGSRWINARPNAEEFAEWFATVPLHDGMEHSDYISGITLIPAIEVVKEEIPTQSGQGKILAPRDQQVFTPYPKVETRVAYFWDYIRKSEGKLAGVIRPAALENQERTGAHGSTQGLPPGFFYLAVPNEKGVATFICCSFEVRIYDRAELREEKENAVPLVQSVGTKQVALLRYADRADENSLMKAETGAMGRALGMAGMLVIPGSGVATAEDMSESIASEEGSGPGATKESIPGAAAAPPPPPDHEAEAAAEVNEDDDLRKKLTAVITEIRTDFPGAWDELAAWAQGRGFTSVGKLTGASLKGFMRKAEKALDDAKKAQAAREGAPEEDLPLEPAAAPQEAQEEPDGGE